MKKFTKKIILVSLFFAFITCKGLNEYKVIGSYYLIDMDYDQKSRSLSYKLADGNYLGIIDETVFAVGYNENYIIVKQHPRKFPEFPNRRVTNYFIVPITKRSTYSPETEILGPLNLQEFSSKCNELNIGKEVKFTEWI